jgi:hypothetical protein
VKYILNEQFGDITDPKTGTDFTIIKTKGSSWPEYSVQPTFRNANPLMAKDSDIEAILSGTINKFSLNNDQAQDLATIIPGIPQSSFRMAIIIKPRKNANLMLDLINIGSIYADQDNQIKVAPQRALHIHSQKMFLYKNFDISPSIGGRLMISELNYNNILINAVGNRYYEPMSRISWYIKLNIGFRN